MARRIEPIAEGHDASSLTDAYDNNQAFVSVRFSTWPDIIHEI